MTCSVCGAWIDDITQGVCDQCGASTDDGAAETALD
jgi:predicted amidophosphoribosyltransferase